jgi:hypothetical protein
MKRNTIIYLMFVLSSSLLFSSSCKKDKELSRTEMIIGKWKSTAQVVTPATDWDGDGDIDSDLFSLMDECIKDNYAIFIAGGTVEENQGPTKCDASDPQSEFLTWSLKNQDKILVVDGDDYIIEEISENSMKLSVSEFGLKVITTLQKF